MLDWILNPLGVDLGAYVVLWIGLIIILIGSVIAAVARVVIRRDKR